MLFREIACYRAEGVPCGRAKGEGCWRPAGGLFAKAKTRYAVFFSFACDNWRQLEKIADQNDLQSAEWHMRAPHSAANGLGHGERFGR